MNLLDRYASYGPLLVNQYTRRRVGSTLTGTRDTPMPERTPELLMEDPPIMKGTIRVEAG